MTTLFDYFAVLKPNLHVDELKVNPEIYQQLDELYHGFQSHTLISAHRFTEDWPGWESHPAGDELVVLISGRAEVLLRWESGDESVVLDSPGAYMVVPKAVWHTARVDQVTDMLFITPGEGTQNATLPRVGS